MIAVAVASSTAANANPRLERTDTAVSVALAEPTSFVRTAVVVAVLAAVVPEAVAPAAAVLEAVAEVVAVEVAAALVLALLAARRVRVRRPALAIWMVRLAPASRRARERAVLEQPAGPHPTGPPMAPPAAGTPAAIMGGELRRKELAPIPCALYFNRDRYRTEADCLTAVYTQQLPLELCR